jgi:hypothetical protein
MWEPSGKMESPQKSLQLAKKSLQLALGLVLLSPERVFRADEETRLELREGWSQGL